ncbi:MAG: cytochrome C oxidase subunit IV family protein [Halorientalis sp.]
MTRTKLYGAVYVVLFVLATAQAGLEMFTDLLETRYWLALGVILVLSVAKALFVAAYYQHLRWEPRSLTYLYLMGLGAAVALTMAASYSIL